jgi:hypothetical protein
MPVGPVHHGGNGQFPSNISHLQASVDPITFHELSRTLRFHRKNLNDFNAAKCGNADFGLFEIIPYSKWCRKTMGTRVDV